MPDSRAVSDQLFHILLSLVDAPRHGYAMIQEIEARTSGAVSLGSSTLYSAIKRILDWEWVEEVEAPPGTDARRRYYALTQAGRVVLRREAARHEALVRDARAKRVLPG